MKTALRPARAQRGGTLVGFVVGVLVGLGVALSVAVYVTRVPVPFVDRGVSRSPAQDAEEAERNKGWNPNAQIAGKPLPVPSTPATTDTAGAISVPPADGQQLPAASQAAATPTAAATRPAATPTAAKPAADPLGDLASARAESAVALVTAP